MPTDFVRTLLISLGLTELIEFAFAYTIGLRGSKDLILIALVNVMTNPAVVLLNAILTRKTELPHLLILVALEAAAILTEGAYYRRYADNIRRPFLFSFGANAFSYFMGLLISHIV